MVKCRMEHELELESLINATIMNVLSGAIEDLQSDLRFEIDPKSIYAKTESLLYKYPLLKKSIQERKNEIEEVMLYGVPQRSKSITMFSNCSGYVDFKSEYEKQEDMIDQLQKKILEAEERLKPIEKALVSVQEDPYFKIIEMKYFNKKTVDQIASYFGCDTSTVQKHKNKMLSQIKVHLFGEEVLKEMMGWLNC